jgi:hypothetical protein
MRRNIITFSLIALLVSLFVSYIFRFHIAVFRYFDPDEWAHIHWSYHFILGQIPYRDFFIYHIPIFQWFLLPFFLLPQSPSALIVMRIVVSVLFIICSIIIGDVIRRSLRNTTTVVISLLLLSVSPIMVDKSLEVRPDMLMVFFYLIAMWLLLFHNKKLHWLFASGFFAGLSLLTFQKILFALPALAVLLIYPFAHTWWKQKKPPTIPIKQWGVFFSGGLLAGSFFLLYLTVNGVLFSGLYAIIRTTSEIYQVGTIRFSPFLALTPWPLVYVPQEGPSIPWSFNIFILLAMLGGTALLAIEKHWKLFWFYVVFYCCSILYLIVFPTPYVQYFIPVIMIGIPTGAIFFQTLLKLIPNGYPTLTAIFIICSVSLLSYTQQYMPRVSSASSNAEQMQVIRDVVQHIRPNETVYDMTGSYVYRPPGYVLCCHNYAKFLDTIKPTPQALTESLIQRNTKFIVLDRSGSVFWLVPEPHKTFIRTNYLESPYRKIYSIGYRYQCTSANCKRINYEGGIINADPAVLPIVISESYKLRTTPPSGTVTVSGIPMKDGETKSFTAGNYPIIIPSTLSEVIIQLDR